MRLSARRDEKRARQARPIPASRRRRLKEAKRRASEKSSTLSARTNAYRVRGVMKDGLRFGRLPDPYQLLATPARKIDHRRPRFAQCQASRGLVQGYNALATVTEQQIVIAAEASVDSPDFGHLEPMVTATEVELPHVGVTSCPGVVLGDAGYWHQVQMESLVDRRLRC